MLLGGGYDVRAMRALRPPARNPRRFLFAGSYSRSGSCSGGIVRRCRGRPPQMPTMLTSGGKQKKQRTRKVGDPVPTFGVPTFDGGPDADDVQNPLEAVIGGHDHQRERVRSHANSGADILLLLHDRCEAAEESEGGGALATVDPSAQSRAVAVRSTTCAHR